MLYIPLLQSIEVIIVFEQRLKAVITDAMDRGNVILLIDEIHY